MWVICAVIKDNKITITADSLSNFASIQASDKYNYGKFWENS